MVKSKGNGPRGRPSKPKKPPAWRKKLTRRIKENLVGSYGLHRHKLSRMGSQLGNHLKASILNLGVTQAELPDDLL